MIALAIKQGLRIERVPLPGREEPHKAVEAYKIIYIKITKII